MSAQPSDRFGPDSSAEEVGLDGGLFELGARQQNGAQATRALKENNMGMEQWTGWSESCSTSLAQ
jgi:hypothetical protein